MFPVLSICGVETYVSNPQIETMYILSLNECFINSLHGQTTISRVSRDIMGQEREVGELIEDGRKAASQARLGWFGGFITKGLSSAFFSKI